MSADGAHVLMVNEDTHTLEDIGRGEPGEVVGYLPDGSQPECGVDGAGESFGGYGLGIGASGQWRPGYHRIATTDGSRVYFQVHPEQRHLRPCAPWQLLERDREAEGGPGNPAGRPAEQEQRADPGDPGRALGLFRQQRSRSTPPTTTNTPDVYRWDEETEKTPA